MRRHARSLEDCLSADAGLARLTNHGRRLLRLQRHLESASPLAQQAQVANLKLGRILIHARTSAVAAKLRQITPRLLELFRAESPEVTGIEIRVQPRPAETGHPSRSIVPIIGEQQKRGLTQLADRLPEGSPLKDSLQRLVKRSR